jgi:hypothetical protein
LDVIGGVDSLSGLNARMIVLRPGQVLFVPPHWWHSVQCVSAGIDEGEQGEDGKEDGLSISVNTWVPVPALDRVMRAREAVANTIVSPMGEFGETRKFIGKRYGALQGMLTTQSQCLISIR